MGPDMWPVRSLLSRCLHWGSPGEFGGRGSGCGLGGSGWPMGSRASASRPFWRSWGMALMNSP